MFTLYKLYFKKRIRFSLVFLAIILAINFLVAFLCIIDEPYRNKYSYKFFYQSLPFILTIVFIAHLVEINKDFYSNKGKMLFSLPIKGCDYVLTKTALIAGDVIIVTAVSFIFTCIVKILTKGNVIVNLTEEVSSVNFREFISIIFVFVLLFSLIFFSIAKSQSMFYQNRAIGGIFSVGFIIVIVILMNMVATIINHVLSFEITLKQGQGSIDLFIPIIEANKFYVVNLIIVILTSIICLARAARIIDKKLNF